MIKKVISCVALCLALAPLCRAQTITRQNIASILGFENNTRAGGVPAGWQGNGGVTDNQVVHSGKYSARIDRNASSAGTFSTLTTGIPLDFAGKTIEWRGYIKWQNVNGFVALWLREDGASQPALAFATLQGLNLGGTHDWIPYSISVPSIANGSQLVFGFLVSGTGTGWVDDLQLLVDGIPVAQAGPRVITVLNTDHEFDNGSRIHLTTVSDVQIQNLVTLGKVWGFLKYHHPAVTGGLHHWDYDLFRVLPQVLNVSDSTGANAVISAWIASLGPVQPCAPCAALDTSNLYLGPDLDWIRNDTLLGTDLSQTLQAIYQNRAGTGRQFFVSLVPNLGNPSFDNELSYGGFSLPDSGYQILALFRLWNMVEYFYPYRDVMADDPVHSPNYWDDVLKASIPTLALARNSFGYQQELMKVIAKINDTHANLWSSLSVRPPIGTCQLPVDVRFVEGKPIIFQYLSAAYGPTSNLMFGDIIEQLDGMSVNDLIAEWTPFYADSNQAARLRDMARGLTAGPCGATSVVVDRGGTTVNVTANRVPISSLDSSPSATHDLPGGTFRMLTDDVAYLKLSSVVASSSAAYVQAAAGAKGWIIDIRNYPSEFVVFTLGQLLVSQLTDFARNTSGDLSNPGAFHLNPPVSLTPLQPHYSGKVVILVDEVTQSQAEYTTMAFRSAGAIVIGSTTAGADGNVSTIPLPGGLSSLFSGNGNFYADNRPTQRVGIIPDVIVRPTIAGIRAGRDELIEEALRQIHGPPATPTMSFSLPDRATASANAAGISQNASVGYGVIRPDGTGSTPFGLEIFGLTQNNVLVSEATVQASPLLQNGRTYAEINDTVNTGLAIANPGETTAVISFYFTDSSGDFAKGTASIPPKGQIAAFLNEAPFNGKSPLTGTFTFSSSVPVAVVTLRGLKNERNEFLITTLPVADLSAASSAGALLFPHFAAGEGWATQIVLSNSTHSLLTGTVRFINPSGLTAGSMPYSIPPRSSMKLNTPASATSVATGSIRVIPDSGTVAPFGSAVFSFNQDGVTVSAAGVPAVPAGTAFRMYAETSADASRIETGIALTNTSAGTADVTLELFNPDGSSTGLKGTLSIPANGQVAEFVNQIPGFSAVPAPFHGVLRATSSASISVIGLRGRYNQRSDFLITTIPPSNETEPPATMPLYFPHLAVGGGYTAEVILFSGQAGQSSSGTVSFFAQGGQPLDVLLQ